MPKKYFNSDLETGGDMVIAGATTVGTTLGVAGATTLASVGVTGAATVGTTLGVTGATTLSSTLAVTAGTQLNNALQVVGSTLLADTLAVAGATTLSNTLVVTGATQIQNSLAVTGTFTTNNTVANTTMLTPKVSSAGDLTLTCDSGSANTSSKIKFCKDSGDTEVASIDQDGTLTSPKVQATGHLTLTCNSDGIADLPASKIKFCKDSGDTEVASIDQDGRLDLSSFITATHIKDHSDTSTNYIALSETIDSVAKSMKIEASGDLVLSPSGDVVVESSANVTLNTNRHIACRKFQYPSNTNVWLECGSSTGHVAVSLSQHIGSPVNTSEFYVEDGNDTKRFRVVADGNIYAPSIPSANNVSADSLVFINSAGKLFKHSIPSATNVSADSLVFTDSTGKLFKHNLVHTNSANATDDYVVYVDNTGTMYKDNNNAWFSQGHLYHSALELALGAAVSLANGSINLTQAANEANCVGIVAAAQALDDTNTHKDSLGTVHTSGYLYKLASLGDSRYKQCNGFKVCNEGGALQPGDLLVTSSTPGYLMKQTDDILRSKTVGKCMQSVTFDDNGQAVDVYGYLYCG